MCDEQPVRKLCASISHEYKAPQMRIKLAQAYHMSTGPCPVDIYTNRVLVVNLEILVCASLIVCAPCLLLRGHACLGNTKSNVHAVHHFS